MGRKEEVKLLQQPFFSFKMRWGGGDPCFCTYPQLPLPGWGDTAFPKLSGHLGLWSILLQSSAAETLPSASAILSTQAGTYRTWNILNFSKTQGKVVNSFPEQVGPPVPVSSTFQDTPLNHSLSISTLLKPGSISLEKPWFCRVEERQIQSEARQGGAHKTGVPTGHVSCPDDLLVFPQAGWGRIRYRQDVPVPQSFTTHSLLGSPLLMFHEGTQDLVGPDGPGQMEHL